MALKTANLSLAANSHIIHQLPFDLYVRRWHAPNTGSPFDYANHQETQTTEDRLLLEAVLEDFHLEKVEQHINFYPDKFPVFHLKVVPQKAPLSVYTIFERFIKGAT